ncbi:MAG: hypothetical protein ISR30_05190, partial [Gammaproteobacteria bacterium]|nr:hypothetical protein [Gammaproteobacteria bacterium]
MTSKIFFNISLLSIFLAGCSHETIHYPDKLNELDKNWLVTPDEAYQRERI